LEKISGSKLAREFYLAGGTGLALLLGHRESIDLDWFASEEFSNQKIKEQLSQLGEFTLSAEEEGTVHGVLDGVRVSFLHYPYFPLFPPAEFEGVQIADERDIAAMKIDAISSRGSKKDFIDLYFLLKKYPLAELLDFFERKYSHIKFNKLHLLKSISYFNDAEEDPMPIMLMPAEWKEMKKELFQSAKDFLKN